MPRRGGGDLPTLPPPRGEGSRGRRLGEGDRRGGGDEPLPRCWDSSPLPLGFLLSPPTSVVFSGRYRHPGNLISDLLTSDLQYSRYYAVQ